MTKWIASLILASLILILSTCTYSLAETGQPTMTHQYGQNLSLDSKVLNETRGLQIYLPEGYETSKINYTVMYILDAQNYYLHGVTYQQTLKFVNKSPDFIVVGINSDFKKRRTLYAHQSDKFIEFLKNELLPFIDKKYRTSDERIYFGWEMAGGLASQIMAQTDLFSAYLMASATHYSEERMQMVAKKMKSHANDTNKTPFLYFTQEGDESWPNELNEVLLKVAPKSLNWKYQLLPDEDHHTAAYDTIYKGLRSYFSDYAPVTFDSLQAFTEFGGLKKLKSHYKARGLRYGLEQGIHHRTQFSLLIRSIREDNYPQFDTFLTEFTGFTDEMAFPSWGDEWSVYYNKNKKFAKAEAVLKKSIAQFPESAMLHANMGDALSGLGQVDAAKASFQRAIILATKDEDPKAKEYEQKLDGLK